MKGHCYEHFLDHSINHHVRCFASSVEDLQYTLADFAAVIVDCLDSSLPSLLGDFFESHLVQRDLPVL